MDTIIVEEENSKNIASSNVCKRFVPRWRAEMPNCAQPPRRFWNNCSLRHIMSDLTLLGKETMPQGEDNSQKYFCNFSFLKLFIDAPV
ncbi:MAG: hypothetical protein ABI210_12655 [Abditibacteriaceae bacterium]